MDKLIASIVNDADKLGTIATLLLFIVGMGWALAKEKLVTGNRFMEQKTSCDKTIEALSAANAELDELQEQLIRLQVEKEYAWKLPRRDTRR